MGKTLIDERYELRGLVGSGGMADVYLAHDEVLDRDVALKLLKAYYAKDEEFVERFRREARSAAALANPYIVPSKSGSRVGGRSHLRQRSRWHSRPLKPYKLPMKRASSTGM
jgi:serine/threonine protein kinase